VVSGKGGVGKSMVTGLLAVTMAREGFRTAVLDADVTGPSIPKMLGIREKAVSNGLGLLPCKSKTGIDVMSVNLLLEDETDPVVWRGPVIAGVVKQFWSEVIWQNVDMMFLDMPPGTADVPLTLFQSIPVDGIIVVTTPQELVSMIVSKAVKMAGMMNVPVLGLVENMSYVVCPDCGKEISVFGEGKTADIVREFGLPVLGCLPIDPKLTAAADAGLLELFEGDWLKPAADLLTGLAEKE
jgi:Mrp family chromosome partitioning ATPase